MKEIALPVEYRLPDFESEELQSHAQLILLYRHLMRLFEALYSEHAWRNDNYPCNQELKKIKQGILISLTEREIHGSLQNVSLKKKKMFCTFCSIESKHIQLCWVSWQNQGSTFILSTYYNYIHLETSIHSAWFSCWHIKYAYLQGAARPR